MQEKEFILTLISDFFKDQTSRRPPISDKAHCLELIKRTALDGLVYAQWQKVEGEGPDWIEPLRQGFEVTRQIDAVNAAICQKLSTLNGQKVIIKEGSYKMLPGYQSGTRYSCDVDLLMFSLDWVRTDAELRDLGFISDGVEFDTRRITRIGFDMNQDLSQYAQYQKAFTADYQEYIQGTSLGSDPKSEFQNLKKKIQDEIRGLIPAFEGNPTGYLAAIEEQKETTATQIKELGGESLLPAFMRLYEISYNRINKILLHTDAKSFQYHNEAGGYLDLHTRLWEETSSIFGIDIESLPLIEQSGTNYLCFKPADCVVLDAVHFFVNINKYGSISFQGFLKCLIDLGYRILLEPIDWDRVAGYGTQQASRAAKLWYFLNLGRIWLKLDIPESVLSKLSAASDSRELRAMDSIDPLCLLFNEPQKAIKAYREKYLMSSKSTWVKYFSIFQKK